MAKPSAKSRPKAKAAVRVELVQKPKPKAAGRKCRTCKAPAAVGNYGYCGVHRTSGPGGKTEAAGAEVPTQPKSGRRRSAAERQQDENSVVTRSCLGEFAAQALAPAAASMGEACLAPLQRACNTLCQLVVAEALQEAVRQRRKSKPSRNSLRKLEISASPAPAAAVETGPLRVNTHDLRAALVTMGFVPSPLLMPAPVGEAAAAASRHFPEGVRPDRIRRHAGRRLLDSARVQQPVRAPVQVRAAQWPALATAEGEPLPELCEGPGPRTTPIRAVFMI